MIGSGKPHVMLASAVLLLGLSACGEQDEPTAQDELQRAQRAQGSGSNTNSNQQLLLLSGQLIQALESHGGVDALTLPDSDQFDQIPQDPNNPINASKVALGKLLFHETGMGVNSFRYEGYQTYSCASCHPAAAGFQSNMPQGIAEGGQGLAQRTKIAHYEPEELDVLTARVPSTLNVAYQEVVLWNGQFGATGPNVGTEWNWTAGTPKAVNALGFHGIETQAIAGQDVHRLSFVDSPISAIASYRTMFDLAFPEEPIGERISDINAGLAIAAYERTKLANKSPWQRWLRGNMRAMRANELRGALLFFGVANCASCHTGPALNSMTFHALGMNDLDTAGEGVFAAGLTNPERLGRGGFTGNPNELYQFKTPQLYNLKDSPFYGHGSSMRSIREVLEYKNNGVAENPLVPAHRLSPAFQPLGLTNSQLNDLEAFITHALHDNKLTRYLPKNLPSRLCPAAADALTKQEQRCQ